MQEAFSQAMALPLLVRMSAQPAVEKNSGASSDDAREQARRSNAELIRLVRDDPEAGLSALHRRYAGSVNRLIWRLLGPDAEHDDIVQQVFLTMLTRIHKLREPATLDVWVRTVTVNAVRQELRRRGVRRVFSSQQRHMHVVGDMVREVESRDLLAQCKEILSKLPAEQRVVFLLHSVEGCTLAEVAELCRCSLVTAKRRFRAADERFSKLVRHKPQLRKALSTVGYRQ